MTSLPHEVPLALFRECPELVPTLLRDLLHLALPPFVEVRVAEADFTQLAPTEFRADLVLTLTAADGSPVLGIIVEVQRQIDGHKRFTWPLYATQLRAKLQCPVVLLVFTDDPAVARWAGRTIALTPDAESRFVPNVLGPERVPWVRSAEEAAGAPELAVLSALAHGNERGGLDVVLAALGAALGLDDDRKRLYYDLIVQSLNEATRRVLEVEMQPGKYEYKTEFAKSYLAQGEAKGKAEGKAEGKASAVLAVFAARGLTVDDATRSRILTTTDLVLLDRWIARAATLSSVRDVLAEG